MKHLVSKHEKEEFLKLCSQITAQRINLVEIIGGDTQLDTYDFEKCKDQAKHLLLDLNQIIKVRDKLLQSLQKVDKG